MQQCLDTKLGLYAESVSENSNLDHNFFFEEIFGIFFKCVIEKSMFDFLWMIVWKLAVA